MSNIDDNINNKNKVDLKSAHDNEHSDWSRRQFMMSGGLLGLGSMFLGKTPLTSFAPNKLLNSIASAETDRVLILFRWFGGNDGLNTVIPHASSVGRSKYDQFRPTLAQKLNRDYTSNTFLSGFGPTEFALPRTMEPLMDLWRNDNMSILHNVGYPAQNFSHFTSSNLWATSSSNRADPKYDSGLIGRFLDVEYPAYLDSPPTVPPALQIGFSNNLLFQSPENIAYDLVFRNPQEFYDLANSGSLHNTKGFEDCPTDNERVFVRQLVNNSLRYADTVIDAYNKSETKATYPSQSVNNISDQLKIISRLIKGNLGTKVYMVYMNGFDTHSDQGDRHVTLTESIGQVVKAFYDDLKADDRDKEVLTMSFSEFGRTITENGSEGTDHGSLAPLFLFGDGVNGGFYGDPMDLNDPTIPLRKRVFWENQKCIDYRSIYATVLRDWLCVDPEVVEFSVGSYGFIDNLIKDPCTPLIGSHNIGHLFGHRPSMTKEGTFEIRYAIKKSSNIQIRVYSKEGQALITLVSGFKERGTHIHEFTPKDYFLKPGEYIYKMDIAGKSSSHRITIEKI